MTPWYLSHWWTLLWYDMRCRVGWHDFKPDFNAKYDRCIHCPKRVRAI